MKWWMACLLPLTIAAPLHATGEEKGDDAPVVQSLSGPEYLLLADHALRAGRLDQAGPMIALLERNPNGANTDDIVLLRAEYLLASGNAGAVGAALAQIQDRERNPCRLEPLLGWEAERNGKMEEAAGHYRHATQACPDDAGLWNRLAMALAASKDMGASKDAFERAMELAPGNVEIVMNFATALLDAGSLPEADALWSHANAIAPEDARVRVMGDILLGAGGKAPERRDNEGDNAFGERLLSAAKGARMTGQDMVVQSLEARALLLIDRYDMDLARKAGGETDK